MARDKNGPKIICQVLIYPATNIYELNTKSWHDFGAGYNLTHENFDKFTSFYVSSLNDRKIFYVSPLLSTNLNNLPDALIVMAELDPLRDDGELYGQKLKASDINVSLTMYTGVMHGFISADKITKKSDNALTEISLYLINQFSKNK